MHFKDIAANCVNLLKKDRPLHISIFMLVTRKTQIMNIINVPPLYYVIKVYHERKKELHKKFRKIFIEKKDIVSAITCFYCKMSVYVIIQ